MQSSFLSSTRALFARIAMSRNKLFVVAWLALVLYPQLLMAQEKRAARPSSGTVEEALSVFITAFDNLDWPAFRECFSPSATVFHPSAPNVRRMTASQNCTRKGVKLRARASSRVNQFLIPNYSFQYVRDGPSDRGTAPAGTKGKAPGTAVSTAGGVA